jgi:hypothetical protein
MPVAIHPLTSTHAPVVTEAVHHTEDAFPTTRSSPRRSVRHRSQPEVAAANPKLDVFPSPLPLSEQERILAAYIARYPEQAAVVAEARMEDLRQEAEERRQIAAGKTDESQ